MKEKADQSAEFMLFNRVNMGQNLKGMFDIGWNPYATKSAEEGTAQYEFGVPHKVLCEYACDNKKHSDFPLTVAFLL